MADGYDLPMGVVTAGPDDGCWVDQLQHSSMHAHHIIPRAVGGEHGPQVLICNSCHDGLHDAAKKHVSAEQYMQMAGAKANWRGFATIERANFLIRTIWNAERATKTSANKTIGMTIKLTAEANARLTAYTRRHGYRSKEAAVIALLEGLTTTL